MKPPTTPAEEAEMRSWCEKATGGPWWVDAVLSNGHYAINLNDSDGFTGHTVIAVTHHGREDTRRSPEQLLADAVFIAVSRSDLPRLLDTVSLLREKLRKVKELAIPTPSLTAHKSWSNEDLLAGVLEDIAAEVADVE